MNVLVTGGAGYVGSVIVEELLSCGYGVVVVDNLCQGHREAVAPDATFEYADLGDKERVAAILRQHRIDAVMHMAAETVIAGSMTAPGKYFRENVTKGLSLLTMMIQQGVKKIVFSSTAAVYGEPETYPIEESHPKKPVNPYGESKLMFERILDWYHQAYGLQYAAMRYFNAAGATESHGEAHHPETHLIPILIEAALGRRESAPVCGLDYETRDGTCIRDYVHVLDLAQAHVLALESLGRIESGAYNLGNGLGFSVLEMIESASRVAGRPIPWAPAPRRPGDPAVLVASSEEARSKLGWQPKHPNADEIVASAWVWHTANPDGYKGGAKAAVRGGSNL